MSLSLSLSLSLTHTHTHTHTHTLTRSHTHTPGGALTCVLLMSLAEGLGASGPGSSESEARQGLKQRAGPAGLGARRGYLAGQGEADAGCRACRFPTAWASWEPSNQAATSGQSPTQPWLYEVPPLWLLWGPPRTEGGSMCAPACVQRHMCVGGGGEKRRGKKMESEVCASLQAAEGLRA